MARPQSFKKNDPRINRKGAPKKEWTIKGLIQEALERKDKEGVTDKQYVYEKLVDMAKSGDMVAQKEMNNRLEGQSKQTIDATIKLPSPIYGSKSKV